MKSFFRKAVMTSLLPVFMATAATAQGKLNDRVASATRVLHELSNVPDKGIPENIAQKAHCVIVVPGFKKGAFLGGAQYGQGLATCYVANKGWSAPAFIQITGVSFGLQIGGESTDLVLVGVTNESGEDLLKDKIKLGGDIAVAAGPVGRNSQASTTETANAGFLSYSRNKGLFAGINLSGDVVNQNNGDTHDFYGHDISFKALLNGDAHNTPAGRRFTREVARVFGGKPRTS